jgi:hypothetical protein
MDKTPLHMRDSSMRSIQVDVRPALDSPTSILDRLVTMPFKQLQGGGLICIHTLIL